ncbi:FAD dependent oxidoreductase [Phycomyces nitens]|nr:FAD dependent oxidoreductase [Phycomyces nitens]
MTSYTPPSPGAKIIIVGGGCFGLSTAYALSLKKKYDIFVFDRLPIPATDAASTDINKIVRMDYSDETLYLQLMLEGLPIWRQWNKERAAEGLDPVYNETGVLFFGSNGKFSDYENKSIKHITEAGYGHVIEHLPTPKSILDKYPQFKHAVESGFDIAYLNKDGGWCNSAEAVKHLYSKCIKNGVHFVLGPEKGAFEKFHERPGSNGIKEVMGIITKDNQVHYADRVIMATGSWTPGLVDMSSQCIATGQVVVQFKPSQSLIGTLKNQPVWCTDVSRTGYYGFPVNKGGIMKVARHASGYLSPRPHDNVSVPRTQVTNSGDTIPVGALKHMRNFLKGFLPQTDSLDVVYSRICWYSDSIDGGFVISPHPQYKNLIVASGDSGHAMKFIPILGYKICHIVEGIDSEYTRAWKWRDLGSKQQADCLRSEVGGSHIIIGDPNAQDARLATLEELKAVNSKL